MIKHFEVDMLWALPRDQNITKIAGEPTSEYRNQALNTIAVYQAMNIIRKGQIR
jgi:hypothetical protein